MAESWRRNECQTDFNCVRACGPADCAATTLAVLSTILVILPLVAIFVYLLYKGASSLNLDFFTHVPEPVGETGGGMANAIVGSVTLLALASVIGVPIGIGGGIYLAEFGRGTKLANAVRFTADVLNGVPSIVMGLAAYALIVYAAKPLLGAFRRRGAGHHDDSHGLPHH